MQKILMFSPRLSKFTLQRLIGVCAALVAVFLVLSTTLAQSQETRRAWSPPEYMGNGWWEDLAIDQEGRVHLSWSLHATTGHDLLYYRQRDLNGNWTDATDVRYTGDGGYTIRHALATTSDGLLHLAYRVQLVHFISGAPIIAANNARHWEEPTQLNIGGYYLDMTAGQDDTLHVVFSGFVPTDDENPQAQVLEGNDCSNCADLFYRQSTDGGRNWSIPEPISVLPASGSDRASIYQGASGRLYITWDEGRDWYAGRGIPQDARIVYSDDNGLNWSEPIILRGDNLRDQAPQQLTLTELRDGRMMVIWRYSDDQANTNIYYQIANEDGSQWSAPTPIPNIVVRRTGQSVLDHYEMLTDRVGTIHMFVVGRPNTESRTNPALYHIQYQPATDTWIAPQRVFYSPELRPEWPEAEIGPSNDIHLTWFTRGMREDVPDTLQCTTCDLRVFYSHLGGNMNPVPTVAFNPTLTPLPTATVFQNIEPSPTPFPTMQLAGRVNMLSQDNTASLITLGGVMVAGLFCMGIFALIRFRR
jgi:hypothetical protein